MASLKTREIIQNLSKKGFAINESRDHIWLNYIAPDGKKTTIRTKISHGKDSIGDQLISAMAKQIKLKTKDFISFSRCDISKDEYYLLVKTNL